MTAFFLVGCSHSAQDLLDKSVYQKGETISITFPSNLDRRYIDIIYEDDDSMATDIPEKIDSITLIDNKFSYIPSRSGTYYFIGYYPPGNLINDLVVEVNVE